MNTSFLHKVWILVLSGLLGMAMAAGAASSERGTTSADFLKIGLGAGPVGLGEACTARSGDVNQMYYNPAGLEGIGENVLAATHLNWIADTQYEVLSYAMPVVGFGTLGTGFFMFHMPDIPGMDEIGNPSGSLRAADLGVQFSMAKDLYPWTDIKGLTAGASLKIVHRELAGLMASGLALDMGGLYTLGPITFGLAGLNLGYLSSFESASEQLPIILRTGASYGLKLSDDHQLAVLWDVVQSLDNVLRSNAGIEYTFRDLAHVRVGYKMGYDVDGLQAGAGVTWQHFSVDYALKTMGVFGLTHYLSLSIGFGDSVRDLKMERVNSILRDAEGLFSRSQYAEALQATEQAVAVDPANEKALQLRDKLRTVLDMLKMPSAAGEQKQDSSAGPKTKDDLEETAPKEVQP